MKIIDKYILKQLAAPFLFGVFAFVSIFIGTDILFDLADYVIEWGVPLLTVMQLFFLSMPEIIVLTFPMATLLATLLVFGRLSGNSEIVALKAGGVSFIRLVIPLLIAAFLISGLNVLIADTLVPRSNEFYSQLTWDIENQESFPTTQKHLRMTPIDSSTDRIDYIFYAYKFDGADMTMEEVSFQDYERGRLAQVIEAERAEWTNQQWKFLDGKIYDLQDGELVPTMNFQEYAVKRLDRTPTQVRRSQQDEDEMTLSELWEWITLRESEGRDVTELKVDFHHRFSIPFASFIFALIGAPLGLQPNRSSTSIGLGLSIVIIFIYYSVMTIGSTLGQSGALAPWLGAWIQNFIFGLVGIGLIIRAAR